MKPQDVLRELRNVQEKHKNDFVTTFGICVSDMARDSANTIETLVGHVKFLWGLLDDIDAAGDMAKSNDKAYRNIVEGIHLKRQLVAESDGYDISIKETLNGWTYHVEIPVEDNDIHTALDILRTEFQKDQSNGSYYDSWVSNIACCIMDQYSNKEKDHINANNAAKAFINLLTMNNGELIIEGLKEGIKESPEFMKKEFYIPKEPELRDNAQKAFDKSNSLKEIKKRATTSCETQFLDD